MKEKDNCYIILLLVVLLASAAAASKEGLDGMVGWTPIKDINDPHITEIANFAVTEYDKRSGSKLKFEKVIKCESQVVAGIKYRLILTANDGSASNNYEAIVWEKLWEHFRNLTHFSLVPHHV